MTTQGSVLFNGEPIGKSVKRRLGFVLQDDLLHETLTVHETLRYTALLRLPRTMSTCASCPVKKNIVAVPIHSPPRNVHFYYVYNCFFGSKYPINILFDFEFLSTDSFVTVKCIDFRSCLHVNPRLTCTLDPAQFRS